MNNNETLDRASLILINCMFNSHIKKDGELFIDLFNYINHHSKDFKDYKFVIIMIIFKGLRIKKWEILKN